MGFAEELGPEMAGEGRYWGTGYCLPFFAGPQSRLRSGCFLLLLCLKEEESRSEIQETQGRAGLGSTAHTKAWTRQGRIPKGSTASASL
jgi:hypothetical protein